MKDYVSHNARMFDSWAEEGWEYGTPLNPEQCQRARQGYYSLYLTSTIPVPKAWLPQKLEEKKVLGLAAGGGQQMAILSLFGARCTLIDISAAQLNADKALAEREGYAIRLVKGDISEPLPFEDNEFDLIVAPVSLCYIRFIEPVINECARVLKSGGVLLIGFDIGTNYLSRDQVHIDTELPYDPIAKPEQYDEDDGYQFSHTVGEQLSALLRASFQIADLFDDYNSAGRLKELHIPSFLAVKAILRK